MAERESVATRTVRRQMSRAGIRPVRPGLIDLCLRPSFDEEFLKAEGALLGHACRHGGLVCSLKLARRVFPNLPSYKLGELSRALGTRFNSRAHRAEANAEVAAQLLIHIGRHLGDAYGLAGVDPDLLVSLNRVAAAKVDASMGVYAAGRRVPA
jgi:DNA polymerase-3 subunit epsilon